MYYEDIQIIKVAKKGRYYYITFSNNENIKFDLEIYYKYNLKEGIILDLKRYALLLEDNDLKLGMNTALNLLTQRMHSTYELKTKLRQKGFNFNTIGKVLEETKSMNLLNDDIFTQNYIDELIARGQGKYKIIKSLQKKGIAKDIIDNSLTELVEPEDEKERALVLMNKKLKSLSGKNIEIRKLREKLARHLISKGFSSGMVFELVNKKIQ